MNTKHIVPAFHTVPSRMMYCTTEPPRQIQLNESSMSNAPMMSHMKGKTIVRNITTGKLHRAPMHVSSGGRRRTKRAFSQKKRQRYVRRTRK